MAHGQFEKWVESLGMATSEARKFMTVAKKLPNRSTLNDLGTSALYLIATLPEEEQQAQINRIEQGDNPTVRELQDVKRQLKLSQADNERLKVQNENLAEQALSKTERVVEKEVVREVVPDDYQFFKSNYEASELREAVQKLEEFHFSEIVKCESKIFIQRE